MLRESGRIGVDLSYLIDAPVFLKEC